jgi:hypothetical protein
MANLTMSSAAQTSIKPPGSAGETEKHLRKAISDVAAKLKAYKEARASRSQPDDGATSDEDSTSDDDENSNDYEISNEETPDTQGISGHHENTGSGKTRVLIKLKLFRNAPQTDDTGIKAITEGMNDHNLGANETSAEDNYESSRGRTLQRQSSKLQRISGMRSTGGRQQTQTASDQDPPLDLNGRDDGNDSESDYSPALKLNDSDDETCDNKDNELFGLACARRRSFEVEAEDYDDWEGFVDDDEGNYYGGYEEEEGDEQDGDADGEEEEDEDDDEESEAAKFDNKYGWSQPQSDRIQWTPPPQPFLNMQTQLSFSSLEESAGAQITESIAEDVSEEQINEDLAEELRRTRLGETQPDAQH